MSENENIETAVRNMIDEAHPTEPLNDEEYLECMAKLGLAVGLLADLPLQRALSTVRRVGTIAPILDPTSYIRGGMQNLDDAERLLRPAVALALTVRAMRKDVIERQAAHARPRDRG